MKKKRIIRIPLLLLLLIIPKLAAQVSHGGSPLPLQLPSTKSYTGVIFKQMPAFDIEEELRLDSLNESDLRSGYRFAYKFMTDYTPENSGTCFTLADGTRIWRLGIYSEGAFSLNILFTRYHLPEGARLFLYNADQTHVLGAFNYLNNSELGVLPIAPIQGDKLIIEYQEPAHVSFHGELTVGEINHGYRAFKGYEPQADQPDFACIPPLSCNEEANLPQNKIGNSVVLLLINGNTACTGTLVNNTANDGKPYLLTASHCLNGQFTIQNPDYAQIAGSLVCFFNYNSPLCSPVMKGTEEMSVSSAWFRAVNEQTDMALLELTETPPPYYQPYYAGWNAVDAGKAPYIGIHHPGASVKRINKCEEEVPLASYSVGNIGFMELAHWKVNQWTTGCTAGGSSGSPLIDAQHHLIGELTGGSSTCDKPKEDFYSALHKSWEPDKDPAKQLKYWLNPAGTNSQRICEGLDPYAVSPCFRLSNIRETGQMDRIETTRLPSGTSDYLFGTNPLGITEYAESYQIPGTGILSGTYLVTPALPYDEQVTVEIRVYGGTDKPETLLHTEPFRPTYTTWNRNGEKFTESDKALRYDQESFVRFSEPIPVAHTFFIGYKITSSEKNRFAVFNLPKGSTSYNTSWMYYTDKWIETTSHPVSPFSTSLFIDPVIQYTTDTATDTPLPSSPVQIMVGAEKKTISIWFSEPIRKARYTLISMAGTVVQNGNLDEQQTTVPVHSLPAGIYLIKINYNNNIYTQKIIF